jgi:choline dehydrogenase-like flavoprotein
MKQQAEEAGNLLREGISHSGGKSLGLPRNSYSTVHVFGSLPLGESHVVDRSGNVRGTGGRVFVRDASILPSHPLVNPQGPLMHLVTALEKRRIEIGR